MTYTRILADELRAHTCGIDCETITPDGRHILYPAAPTIDAGRYQYDKNAGMTRRAYRASGQDESRECRVWAANRSIVLGERGQYQRAARLLQAEVRTERAGGFL